jgi:cytochrome c1
MLRPRPRTAGKVLLCCAGVAAALAAGCARDDRPLRPVPDGNPARGKQQMVAYGCGSCHVIPGVDQAHGLVGPPLDHFARRPYIAGEVPNNLRFLMQWISVPQSIEPGTAMPNLGVTAGQARDMAAYLYSLR